MSRVLLSALLLTSCAPEVAPHADPGDPRVLPIGATAALDGSFSEGDGLTYAWAVEPEGATILDAESPFATLIAEAPGFYTVSLEVCDDTGRCDTAETWARVDDAPGNTSRISDWTPDEFAGVESGAGAPFGVAPKSWCDKCYKMCHADRTDWEEFCRNGLPKTFKGAERSECWQKAGSTSSQRERYCDARCAE